MFISKNTFFNVIITITVKQISIQLVSDSTTILDLTDHVFDDSTVDLQLLLCGTRTNQTIQILLNEH